MRVRDKSLHEIFEWFDCVESVNLHGGKHPHVRLITEQIKRDKKFLEVIGYKSHHITSDVLDKLMPWNMA